MKYKKTFYCFVFLIIFIIINPLLINAVTGEQNPDFIQEARELEKNGIIKGDKNGDLMLSSHLQKQDLVIIVSRLYGKDSSAKNNTYKIDFKDVEKDTYYYNYIAWAVEKGIIDGISDEEFGIGKPVTLKEIETILLRILGYDEEAKNWDLIESLSDTIGLAESITIPPGEELTRGQIAKIITNALNIERKGSTLKLRNVLNIQ